MVLVLNADHFKGKLKELRVLRDVNLCIWVSSSWCFEGKTVLQNSWNFSSIRCHIL